MAEKESIHVLVSASLHLYSSCGNFCPIWYNVDKKCVNLFKIVALSAIILFINKWVWCDFGGTVLDGLCWRRQPEPALTQAGASGHGAPQTPLLPAGGGTWLPSQQGRGPQGPQGMDNLWMWDRGRCLTKLKGFCWTYTLKSRYNTMFRVQMVQQRCKWNSDVRYFR